MPSYVSPPHSHAGEHPFQGSSGRDELDPLSLVLGLLHLSILPEVGRQLSVMLAAPWALN